MAGLGVGSVLSHRMSPFFLGKYLRERSERERRVKKRGGGTLSAAAVETQPRDDGVQAAAPSLRSLRSLATVRLVLDALLPQGNPVRRAEERAVRRHQLRLLLRELGVRLLLLFLPPPLVLILFHLSPLPFPAHLHEDPVELVQVHLLHALQVALHLLRANAATKDLHDGLPAALGAQLDCRHNLACLLRLLPLVLVHVAQLLVPQAHVEDLLRLLPLCAVIVGHHDLLVVIVAVPVRVVLLVLLDQAHALDPLQSPHAGDLGSAGLCPRRLLLGDCVRGVSRRRAYIMGCVMYTYAASACSSASWPAPSPSRASCSPWRPCRPS